MKDVIGIIESAYAGEATTESAWLAAVARSVRSNVPAFAGSVFAYTYEVRADGWIDIQSAATEGDAPVGAAFSGVEFSPLVRDMVARFHLVSGIDSGARVLGPYLAEPAVKTLAEAAILSHGFQDMVVVKAVNPSRSGCMIGVLSKKAETFNRSTQASWRRVSAHIAAGLRLRTKMEKAGPAALSTETADAVLTTGGRIEHATDTAVPRAARDALQLGARAIERARGPLRRSDPDEAVDVWRGLIAGRWSLVDHFDSDGRRYIVAHRNDPATPDPRALTERERQVAAYAALGQSNKLIAYELGLSPSTVGVLLARARAKLGTMHL
jgi:DNA-binding NarL/FixJ family response regulator